MDPTGQSLLKLLFNEGETICVSPNEFGYKSIPLEKALSGELTLESSNESGDKRYCNSSDLTMCAINPIKGRRKDESVTAFRSYLIEIDVGSTIEQLATIKHLKMPYSAQVFSGNKSVHTAIVLDEDLPDEKTYRFIAKWIFNIITIADDKCKNPSRSIRIPGAYRDNGKKQRLIKLKTRISHKELFDWLNQYEHLKPQVAQRRRGYGIGGGNFSKLSPWARGQLQYGIKFDKGRNQTWFSLAVDMAKAGFSEEKSIETLSQRFQEEHDFKEKEFLTAIGSGFKYVRDEK